MRYSEILEMALNRRVLGGDWSTDDTNTGFSGADRKLQLSSAHLEKTFKFFNKTPFPFSFFFINNHNLLRDLETNSYNLVKPLASKIIKIVGEKVAADIKQAYADNDIIVFFTNNEGDESVPLTPWIMAHRFGHCLASSTSDQLISTNATMKEYFSEFIITNYNFVDSKTNKIITNDTEMDQYHHHSKLYKDSGLPSRIGYVIDDNHKRFKLKHFEAALYNYIGTQSSSRKNKILPKRENEFFLELFAQYIHDNTITLNNMPNVIKSDEVGYYLKIKDGVDSTTFIQTITQFFNNETKKLLNSCKGKCYIM